MTKYAYSKVIQQYYYGCYGWEDVSEYETNSTYSKFKEEGMTKKIFLSDLKEYKLQHPATRVIQRKKLRTED